MGAFTPAGSNVTSRITFNSGTIDFGNQRLVAVDNVAISIEYTLSDLFILNSIKAADKVRHSQKVTMTGKIKSYAPELEALALGSSTIGSPNTLYSLDGQPTFQNPVFTGFDRNGKEFQYQFVNALFKSTKMTARNEEFTEWDFDLEAIDIYEVYTT